MPLVKRGLFYYADIYYRGKRLRKSLGSNKRVAEALYKDLALKVEKEEAGIYVKDVLLSQFFEECLSYAKTNHRASTYLRYKEAFDHLKDFVEKESDVKRMSHVTEKFFEDYKAFRKGKAKSGTVNIELKVFKSYFNRAVRWGYARENPLKHVERLDTFDQKIPRFYSKEELNLIWDYAPQPYKDIFTIFPYSGLRRNELRFLDCKAIDFENDRINITQTSTFTPKTAERSIPLHKKLIPIFEKHIGNRRSGLIFPTRKGTPYPENYWWKVLQKVIAKINLEHPDKAIDNCDIHTFRHTFASWLIMSGADLPTVQKLLGHASIKTTMIYIHLYQQHLKENVDKLDF